MAVFVFDVLGHRFAQPFQTCRQTRAAGHHQRHGVTHVVVRLREKRPIAFQADLALQGVKNDRQIEQLVAFLMRGFLQGVEKLMMRTPRKQRIQSIGRGTARQSPRGAADRWR